MKRWPRFAARALGVIVTSCIVSGVVFFLAAENRYQNVVTTISQKLAPVLVANPDVVWDTDLRPFGFPRDVFDSPYTHSQAEETVALSRTSAAVAFRKSRFVEKKLITDGYVLTLSLKDGSLLGTAHRPGPIDIGPTAACCTDDGQFYSYADGYFIVRDGEIAGTQKNGPGAKLGFPKVNVKLGYSDIPATVEIVHDDQTTSHYQAQCGYVLDSYVSKTLLAIVGCDAVTVIGMDGRVLFADIFQEGYLHFGGASKNGKRFVVVVSSLHSGDPPYLTDEWLVVYDVERRGPIFALKSDTLPYQQSQSALTPEGDHLLVGSGGHVKLVSLPN